MEKIVHIEDELPFKPVANISNITSEIFNSRNKNITSEFILNSITNSLNPKPKKQNKTAPNQIQIPNVNDLDVSEFEFNLFKECLILSAQSKKITLNNGQVLNPPSKLKLTNPNNKIIQFGDYEIESWFRSPYPNEMINKNYFNEDSHENQSLNFTNKYERFLSKFKTLSGTDKYQKYVISAFNPDDKRFMIISQDGVKNISKNQMINKLEIECKCVTTCAKCTCCKAKLNCTSLCHNGTENPNCTNKRNSEKRKNDDNDNELQQKQRIKREEEIKDDANENEQQDEVEDDEDDYENDDDNENND